MATRDIAAEINAAVAAGNDALTNQLLAERYAKIQADPTLFAKYGNDVYSQAYTGLQKAQASGTTSYTPTAAPVVTSTPPSTPSYTPVSTPTTPVEPTVALMKAQNASAPPPAAPPALSTPTAPSTTAPTFNATGNTPVDNILQQMTANSAAWHTADAATKAKLAAANQTFASTLQSQYGITAQIDGAGKWNVLNYGSSTTGGGLQGQTVQSPLGGSVTFAPDPIIPPAQYVTMNPQDIYSAIMNSSTNVSQVFALVQQLAQQALTAGNVDVTAVVKTYLDQIENSLSTMQSKYDEMYADGPNDPGLQAALQMMRESAEETRTQMLEELNARGLSRSGLLVKAEERFVKGAASQEAQLIGSFMSDLYKTYMQSLTNITNQRVGVLAQMGQLVGEAAIQSASNRVAALNAAMDSMTSIGNTMASMHSQAWNTAYSAYNDAMTYNETARHNYTSEQEQRRANMAQEGLAGQELAQTGAMDFLKLQETIRSNKAGETLQQTQLDNTLNIQLKQIGVDIAQLEEQRRSNKASEAISYAQIAQRREEAAINASQNAATLRLRAQELNLDIQSRIQGIKNTSMANTIAEREIALAESKFEEDKLNATWQRDAAKAETMALHAASTADAIKKFMDDLESGAQSYDTAAADYAALHGLLGINSKVHNATLEEQLYKQGADKLNEMLAAKQKSDANWNSFWNALNDTSRAIQYNGNTTWYTPSIHLQF